MNFDFEKRLIGSKKPSVSLTLSVSRDLQVGTPVIFRNHLYQQHARHHRNVNKHKNISCKGISSTIAQLRGSVY